MGVASSTYNNETQGNGANSVPFYVLEGQIGVGKTELSKKATQSGWYVLGEHINKKLLRLFYNDSKAYGFTFQLNMLQSRLYHSRLLRVMPNDDHIGRLADRSLLGDWMFTICNFLLGNIKPCELDVYEHEIGCTADCLESFWFWKQVDKLIYLDDSPEACKQRVEEVRRNSEEKNIPLWYYECVDDVYFFMIRCVLGNEKLRQKLRVLCWSQYDDWKSVNSAVHCVYNCSDQNNEKRLYYEDADIIKRDYMRYCIRKEPLDHQLPVIAFSSTIMDRTDMSYLCIDGSSKRQLYHKLIWRKQNEYKRLVMFYLSEGRHVIFI